MKTLTCSIRIYFTRRQVRRIRARYGARDYKTRELLGNHMGAIAYRLNNECGMTQGEVAELIGYSRAWTSTLIARHSKALAR